MKDSYDYKPLLIKVFNNKSEGIEDIFIDGTRVESCVSLAEKNTKKLNGRYFEIRSRDDDKLIYSSVQ